MRIMKLTTFKKSLSYMDFPMKKLKKYGIAMMINVELNLFQANLGPVAGTEGVFECNTPNVIDIQKLLLHRNY